MSFTSPAYQIPRQAITGMEGMWVKMWDPPTASPETPDLILPTNPVPEVMAAAGLQKTPSAPHTVQRDLLHGVTLPAWDGKQLHFMTFRDGDNPSAVGTFPGPTIRLPRGVWFHGDSLGHGPPPHTIHWHGIEPTPINDGVGHCSMEVGRYVYQWQPNFIGFYFCHCHRNTVQHFEFGLYQALLIDPPDAYFATQWNPAIPLGAGRDGKRRIAANLATLRGPTGGLVPMDAGSGAGFEGPIIANPFPGFIGGSISDPDPEAGNPALPGYLKFPVNPHAMTVPYDVEALWVVDDRDSRWSDLAPDARATYPKHGNTPGVDDNFAGNAGGGIGPNDFFAFNDFNPDYWYVTGVSVPGPKGGSGEIPPGIVIPPALICGTETQVSIEAKVGQTILVRCLDAAYNNVTYRFPVDVTVIAWDGRALGVAPFNSCNHAYTVPAGTPIHASVARRFDALIRVDSPISGYAEVDFTDTRCGTATGFERPLLFTARIPINIAAAPVGGIYTVSGTVRDAQGAGLTGVTVHLTGAATATAITDGAGSYSVAGLGNGAYAITPSLAGQTFAPATVVVNVNGADVTGQDFAATAPAGAYSISGSVFNRRTGAAIAGVQMNLLGPVNGLAVSDAYGNYTFAGLPDGRYKVLASHAGYRFAPREARVRLRGAGQSGVLFMGR